MIHFNVVYHNYELDLPGIKRDPCGKRSTSRLSYGTAIFKTDPAYLTENTPRAVVTNSGLMLFNEIIRFCCSEKYEIREFTVLRIAESFRIMQQVVWMPSSLGLNRVAAGR